MASGPLSWQDFREMDPGRHFSLYLTWELSDEWMYLIRWKSYMCTVVFKKCMKANLAVMNTTHVVVKIRPEKNWGMCGI